MSRRGSRQRPRPAAEPIAEIEIESLGHLGDGRGHYGSGEVLVDGALPGERWSVRLASQGRGRWRGEPLHALRAVDRAKPVCLHFGACGGCRLQHVPLEDYGRLKRGRITKALEHRGIRDPELLPTKSSPLGSRRRLRLAFDGQGNLGLRRRRGRSVVDLEMCTIADPAIVAALPGIAPTHTPHRRCR